MKITRYPSAADFTALLKRPAASLADIEPQVQAIMNEVRTRGDAALREYTERFDKISIGNFLVPDADFTAAEKSLDLKLKEAILLAKANIERFHIAQHIGVRKIETMPGVSCWRKSIPVERAGLYIPGGSAPLFSTILMLAVPAKLAGCKEIVLCSPPSSDGKIHPAILFAAKACGVHKVFAVGGAQAIAAMAYGTETIPRADKIFGPGNSWVTCAKQLLSREGIAIDLPAGPSELAIFADETVPPAFIAADLLSQAEHGPDSQVVLVSENETVLQNVINELEIQTQVLPRKEIAMKSLENSHAFLVASLQTGMELLNAYAPEHLILACANPENAADLVINAGSVFLGPWSPESAGDYASGTNHTLPTNGYARGWSGVSLDSFVKKVTFQQITQDGLRRIGSAVETMAEAEGLFAHKNAVTIRLKS